MRCTSRKRGAPAAILEAGGNDSYENMPMPRRRCTAHEAHGGARDDRPVPRGPLHGHRLGPGPGAVAHARPRPRPIKGWSTVPYFLKEAVGVGLGRIIGYNHLEWLHDA